MRPLLPPLAVLLAGLAAGGCASTPEPLQLDAHQIAAAEDEDLVLRLAEAGAQPPEADTNLLLRSLERLQLSWQSEQRRGRARHLEIVLTQKVLPNFDAIAATFLTGPHDQRLVAAWALGFSRVPPNDKGVLSRHEEAATLLAAHLETLPDDVLANALLALWKLGEPRTPLRPVLDIAAHHHDPEVRANAVLAVGAILTNETAFQAIDTVLLAFEDSEDKVRLHATDVARRHPAKVYTERLQTMLPNETTPLVRACIAAALGSAGDRSSGSLLVPLLGSPREIEVIYAHAALVRLYGEDLGKDPRAWSERVKRS